jgi:hypothetical protein
MKNLLLGTLVIAVLIGVQLPVFAQDKMIIEREGDDLTMRPQYDYDCSKRYTGTIDDDGSVRLRNPQTGDVLRGDIDSDGYGYLRDSEGDRVRVRPR